MSTLPESHKGRTAIDGVCALPHTIAPCGVYFDCLPDAIAFLKRQIPEMETNLISPFADEQSQAYKFDREYLPKWRRLLVEYVRDLASVQTEGK